MKTSSSNINESGTLKTEKVEYKEGKFYTLDGVEFEDQTRIIKEVAYQLNGHLTILDIEQYKKHYFKEGLYTIPEQRVEIWASALSKNGVARLVPSSLEKQEKNKIMKIIYINGKLFETDKDSMTHAQLCFMIQVPSENAGIYINESMFPMTSLNFDTPIPIHHNDRFDIMRMQVPFRLSDHKPHSKKIESLPSNKEKKTLQLNRIREILSGIDEIESESKEGWWETSTGAEFGASKLKVLLDYIDSQFKGSLQGEDQEPFAKEIKEALDDKLWFEFCWDIGSIRHLLHGETEPERWEEFRKQISEKWNISFTRKVVNG